MRELSNILRPEKPYRFEALPQVETCLPCSIPHFEERIFSLIQFYKICLYKKGTLPSSDKLILFIQQLGLGSLEWGRRFETSRRLSAPPVPIASCVPAALTPLNRPATEQVLHFEAKPKKAPRKKIKTKRPTPVPHPPKLTAHYFLAAASLLFFFYILSMPTAKAPRIQAEDTELVQRFHHDIKLQLEETAHIPIVSWPFEVTPYNLHDIDFDELAEMQMKDFANRR